MSERTPLDPHIFGTTQRCYGCGPQNPVGMRLRFERDGDSVVTRFVPSEGLEGPPDVFHGGLQATLADEVAGWALVGLLGRMGFTTSMSVRFIRPMKIRAEVVARARIASRTGNVVNVDVTLSQNGRAGLMGTVTYRLPDAEKARDYLGGELPESWEHLFAPLP